jgi:hypothetical protein
VAAPSLANICVESISLVYRWFYGFELAGNYRRDLGTEEEIEMTATQHFDVLEVRCPGNLEAT